MLVSDSIIREPKDPDFYCEDFPNIDTPGLPFALNANAVLYDD